MSNLEARVRAEQLRLLFKSPISFLGSAATAAVAAAVLGGRIDAWLLLSWAGLTLAWLGGRAVLWLWFRRETSDQALIARWSWRAVGIMAASGILWGLFGAAFYLPADPEFSAFMILVVASMLAGGAFMYAAYLPAYYAFIVCCTLPIAAAAFQHGTPSSIVFGLMTLAYLASMLGMGRTMNRSIVKMIGLRFANADLVANLRQAKETAEIASRVKSEFLATMSHELRTPLNAVLGFSEMIQAGTSGPIDAKYRAYAADIHSSGEHLLALISDILDISKIESGRLDIHDDRASLADIMPRCLRLIAPRAAEGELALIERLPPDLPDVIVDEVRIKQALINLLSNAVKFTPAGGRIEVSARTAEDGGVEIAVADDGIGMRPEDVPVALEPFRQLDSRLARPYEGTGLGLPLAKRLIELHGGALVIDTAPERGTRVALRLPPERVIRRGSAAFSASAAD
ncbi:MAG TPA: ATP-binding protein [Stellaceae bacterium]|nr:ATP-binding protein [Stellaceae bacterium]